jgi:MarR family transcriptional regulator for hemolysin
MPSILREFAFSVNDVARQLRTYADQHASRFGMSRAQWAVLVRLEANQGLKQSELADMLDIQPISLTRLVDRLCDSGLIERRADPADRRAKRLFLTPAAAPVVARLNALGEELLTETLDGLDTAEIEDLNRKLAAIKNNLRRAIAKKWSEPSLNEATRHG